MAENSNPEYEWLVGRVKDIALKHAPDYPDIENETSGAHLWAIESTLDGVNAANEQLHDVIKILAERCGMSPAEVAELVENPEAGLRNTKLGYIRKLEKRIHNQRLALKENWQTFEERLLCRAHYAKPRWWEKLLEQIQENKRLRKLLDDNGIHDEHAKEGG